MFMTYYNKSKAHMKKYSHNKRGSSNAKSFNEIQQGFPTISFVHEGSLNFMNKNSKHSNFYSIIPKGKKGYLWFTRKNNNDVCYFLYSNKKGTNITHYEIKTACYHNKLSCNTIVYGTVTKIQNVEMFCVENIMYYQNIHVSNLKLSAKQRYIYQFLHNVSNVEHIPDTLRFFVPIMSNSFVNILSALKEIPYTAFSIQYNDFKDNNIKTRNRILIGKYESNTDAYEKLSHFIDSKKNKTGEQMIKPQLPVSHKNKQENVKQFLVKPKSQNDIYEVFTLNGTYQGVAHIPTYERSVFLNNIFRTIKENTNLDTLEESDDEEDFENINDDKYLNPQTINGVNMICKFDEQFKRWTPISLSS